MEISQQQITNTVLMVSPRDFAYNDQTAKDNEFQQKDSELSESLINTKAMEEFNNSVILLRSHGINVLVFDKKDILQLKEDKAPDSVFPNNWLSTDSKGRIFIYPMAAPNRRLETKAFPFIKELLLENGFKFSEIIEIKGDENQYLEGTGSMIFDKINNKVFAALSYRTDSILLDKYSNITKEEIIKFEAKSTTGKPFYHTNILLCIGEGFATICLDSIPDKNEREKVIEKLTENKLEIIDIDMEQTEKHLCGNMLHVKNDKNEKFIVLSERALKGLKNEQKKQLEKYGKFIALPLSVIEDIGGGSARCMLCEIFLNKK